MPTQTPTRSRIGVFFRLEIDIVAARARAKWPGSALARYLLVNRVQPFLMPTWPRRSISEIKRRGLFFVELSSILWIAGRYTELPGKRSLSQDANRAIADCNLARFQSDLFT